LHRLPLLVGDDLPFRVGGGWMIIMKVAQRIVGSGGWTGT
jgi:hypothetical protein